MISNRKTCEHNESHGMGLIGWVYWLLLGAGIGKCLSNLLLLLAWWES